MINENKDCDWKNTLSGYLLASPVYFCCDDKTWTPDKDTDGYKLNKKFKFLILQYTSIPHIVVCICACNFWCIRKNIFGPIMHFYFLVSWLLFFQIFCFLVNILNMQKNNNIFLLFKNISRISPMFCDLGVSYFYPFRVVLS